MALDVESVVDGSMARQEFLRRAGALEPLHLAFPASGRLMRILGAVVLCALARRTVLILWDNRATMHRGRPWPGTQARLMVRTTISARDIDGLDQVRPN
jgi:hypothetical protein